MYSAEQDILTIGDGDLSFSLSLARRYGGQRITATTFDSYTTLCRKYPWVIGIIAQLRVLGSRVLHGVDGRNIAGAPGMRKGVLFDRIIFNFPHNDTRYFGTHGNPTLFKNSHKKLIQEFFVSCEKVLKPHGEVHVALHHWQDMHINGIAAQVGLHLKSMHPFNAHAFPGYNFRCTNHHQNEDQVRHEIEHGGNTDYCYVIGITPRGPTLPSSTAAILKSVSKLVDLLVGARRRRRPTW